MVTQAMGINTDPNYSRAMDTDMALSSSSDLVITLAPMVAQVTQINKALSSSLDLVIT